MSDLVTLALIFGPLIIRLWIWYNEAYWSAVLAALSRSP
jgi:hypothetical protein